METAVAFGDPVPEEKDVEENTDNEEQESEHPDEQGEHHARQYRGLHGVLHVQSFELTEELRECAFHRQAVSGNELGSVHGVQGRSIDNLAGA